MKRLVEIIYKPADVYAEMKEDPSPVLPLVVVLVVLVVCAILAVSLIDPEAVAAQQLQAQETLLKQMNVPEEQIELQMEQMKQALDAPTTGVMTMIGAPIGAVVAYFFVLILLTLYFLIVSKTMKLDLSFSDWFAFSCWGVVPMILPAVVAVLAVIADPTTVTPPDYLAPLIWFGLTLGGYEGALSIDNILMIFIMAMGFQVWSQKSVGVSVTVAVVPFLIGVILATELTRALGPLGAMLGA